jgi:predicted enzyme related to lactoylglutathione lyase
MAAPPNWLYYALVAELDKAIDRVKAGHGMLVNGPMDIPRGEKAAVCMDPQGGAFAMHWRPAAQG